MNDLVSIPKKEIDIMNNRIAHLEGVVRRFAERFNIPEEEVVPKEGTEEWWLWAEKQAEEDIKENRGIELHSKEDIDRYFDTL